MYWWGDKIENLSNFNELWDRILNSIPDIVIVVDLDDNIVKINKSMERLLNGKSEYYIGKKCYELTYVFKIPESNLHLNIPDNYSKTPVEEQYKNLVISMTPIYSDNGEIQGNIHLIRNHYELNQIDSKGKLAAIVNYSNNAIYSKDLNGDITSWNSAAQRVYGYKFEEVQGKHFKILYPKNKHEKFNKILKKVLKGKAVTIETVHKTKKGKQINVLLSIAPIFNNNGIVEGTSTIANDITDKKKAENELRESEERLKLTLDALKDGIWDWNLKTDKTFISPSFYKMLGYEPDEFPQIFDYAKKLVHPEDYEKSLKKIGEIISNNKKYYHEFRMKSKNDDWRWIQSRGKIVERDYNNNPIRIVGIHTDITEKKIAEAKIEKSLIEKTNLIREIHHRVKNNMQIVSSLLNLQKRYVEDEEAINVLQGSQDRIRTMAMIHEKLYKSQNFTHVNIKEYVDDLIYNLRYSYAMPAEKIKLISQIEEDITLNIETALPCGLIISELVSNCIKYAFPNDLTGILDISLRSNDNHYSLTVKDNGIGLPKNFDMAKTGTLGMQLILNLVDQLEGKITFETDPGLEYHIDFKELPYQERIQI